MCQGELRHWKTGHYTLVHDNSKTEFALDLFLYCGCEGRKEQGRVVSLVQAGSPGGLSPADPTPKYFSVAMLSQF